MSSKHLEIKFGYFTSDEQNVQRATRGVNINRSSVFTHSVAYTCPFWPEERVVVPRGAPVFHEALVCAQHRHGLFMHPQWRMYNC